MEQLEKKKACVLFRSIVEAAEELDTNEALELLLNYAHIGLGDEVDLDKCSKTVRLILKQNVECLGAAERRYEAACENGKKGKDAGKKGGRPRKGETKEQAYERRNPSKTPEETPVNSIEKTPVKPLEEEVYTEVEKEVDIEKEREFTYEEFIERLRILSCKFIEKHKDYNYNLELSIFQVTYFDNLYKFQEYVNNELSTQLSIEDCCKLILSYSNT